MSLFSPDPRMREDGRLSFRQRARIAATKTGRLGDWETGSDSLRLRRPFLPESPSPQVPKSSEMAVAAIVLLGVALTLAALAAWLF